MCGEIKETIPNGPMAQKVHREAIYGLKFAQLRYKKVYTSQPSKSGAAVKPTDFTAVVGYGCSQVKILILINMGMWCFTHVNIIYASFAFASLVYLKNPFSYLIWKIQMTSWPIEMIPCIRAFNVSYMFIRDNHVMPPPRERCFQISLKLWYY